MFILILYSDVNECEGEDPCSANANCVNIPGSFTCTCYEGYTGDGAICTGIHQLFCFTQMHRQGFLAGLLK